MALTVQYDASIDALVTHASGEIVYHDLPPLVQTIIEHENFRTNINQLFDCTEGELNLTMQDLRRIAAGFESVAHVLGVERKLALAVTRLVDFGMMRQYEAFFSSGPDVQVWAFRDLKEARDWLKSDRIERAAIA